MEMANEEINALTERAKAVWLRVRRVILLMTLNPAQARDLIVIWEINDDYETAIHSGIGELQTIRAELLELGVELSL